MELHLIFSLCDAWAALNIGSLAIEAQIRQDFHSEKLNTKKKTPFKWGENGPRNTIRILKHLVGFASSKFNEEHGGFPSLLCFFFKFQK